MNPIIAMLHDVKHDRFHPIVFLERPLPGPVSDDKPVRHQSEMHHTTGFATREEALQDAQSENFVKRVKSIWGNPRFALAKDFAWDGEGIPSFVAFFEVVDGELTPVF